MIKIKFNLVLFLSFLFVVFLMSCTKNPFGDDEISDKGRRITGSVTLSHGATPKGVYIWLEGVDVGTFTDDNGGFMLSLPPASSQSGGGMSGSFRLFFFMSNYRVDTTSVVLRKGLIQPGQGGVNEESELYETKRLNKILNISVANDPSSYPAFQENNDPIREYCYPSTGYETPLSIAIELEVISGNVTVKYPGGLGGPVSRVLLERVESDTEFVQYLPLNSASPVASLSTSTIIENSRVWMTGFEIEPDILPKGKYRIIPYLLIMQQDVPEELLNNLISDIYRPGYDMIDLPTVISGGYVEVTK